MLNPEGHRETAELFQNYRNRSNPVDPSLEGTRILLTGFGLFKDLPLNSSGAIVANIANPEIWPDRFRANEIVSLPDSIDLHDGKFETNQGGVCFQRSLTINNRLFNFRILILDVLWDVAGAIVAYEMDRFQPEAVLMLGGGGGPILEGGALNQRKPMEGFYANGLRAPNNFPIAGKGLGRFDEGAELIMSWNNEKILESVQPLLKEAGLSLTSVPRARPDNIYLCNEVSLLALVAARGFPIDLAGGGISFQPKIDSDPKIGFFHLPWELPLHKDVIERWGSLVVSIAYFQPHA